LNKRILLIFGIPSIILTVIGALLVNYISQNILKFILGLFLLVYVIISWKKGFSVKSTRTNLITGGSLSGFFAGLIGTGGALRGAFLTSLKLDKSIYIATAAAISLAVDITRIPIYLANGFLPRNLLYFIPLLFILAIAGSFVGKKIVHKIPQKKFRKFVLFVIGIVSLKFLYEGIIYFI